MKKDMNIKVDEKNEYFSIRMIQKKKIKNYSLFRSEVNKLKTLEHKNVIKVHEVWETLQAVYIIQELFEGGNLFENLVQKKFLSEDISKFCVK